MRIQILTTIVSYLILVSCVSKKEDGLYVSDATVYNLSQTTSSYEFYKNNEDRLLSRLVPIFYLYE